MPIVSSLWSVTPSTTMFAERAISDIYVRGSSLREQVHIAPGCFYHSVALYSSGFVQRRFCASNSFSWDNR